MHNVQIPFGLDFLNFARGESSPRAVLDIELRKLPVGLGVALTRIPGHILHPCEVVRRPPLFFRDPPNRPHRLDLLRVLVDDDQLIASHSHADEQPVAPAGIDLLHLRRPAVVLPQHLFAELES